MTHNYQKIRQKHQLNGLKHIKFYRNNIIILKYDHLK